MFVCSAEHHQILGTITPLHKKKTYPLFGTNMHFIYNPEIPGILDGLLP